MTFLLHEDQKNQFAAEIDHNRIFCETSQNTISYVSVFFQFLSISLSSEESPDITAEKILGLFLRLWQPQILYFFSEKLCFYVKVSKYVTDEKNTF